MNDKQSIKTPNATLLFHLSDTLTDSIVPTGNRPKFYWFNDRYHSHIYGDSPGAEYMYFFLVEPGNTAAKLFTRHGDGDFQSMWSDYQAYLEARDQNERDGVESYLEPGIVFSFSELIPDLVCRFTDGFNVSAKVPGANSEATFCLREGGRFRRFDAIPEVVNAIPGITEAVPIIKPTSLDDGRLSEFWTADTENQGRMWL